MFVSLLCAFAAGFAMVAAVFAIAIPFVLGLFGRRDTP